MHRNSLQLSSAFVTRYVWFIINGFLALILVTFILDGLIADWTLNPFYDILLARVQGPLFQNTHAMSMLTVCFVAVYRVAKAAHDKETHPFKWVLLVFTTIGLHEFSLFYWNIALAHNGGCACGQDAFWYAAFLIAGVAVATRQQRKFIYVIGAYCFISMYVYVAYFGNSDLQTLANGRPFIVNSFVEVFSWVSAAVVWVLA